MEKFISSLKKLSLFAGIEDLCIESFLKCCNARYTDYDKGESIMVSGKIYDEFGILMQGKAKIIQEDFWGNENLLSIVKESELFAEAFSIIPHIESAISVIAMEKCTVLWINASKIMTVCKKECLSHDAVIKNILLDFAGKNIYLNTKINHLSKRTTRQKIMSYLSDMARETSRNEFDIPFNRQQLADYLAVDRSAMCTELSKLQKSGMIEYSKNHFVMKNNDSI